MSDEQKSIFTQHDIELLASLVKEKGIRIFGFKIQDLVVIGSIIFGIFAFYLRTNDTLNGLDRFRIYTTSFMDNSDAYHSNVLGTYFRQGRPLDNNFDTKKVRDILNGQAHSSVVGKTSS